MCNTIGMPCVRTIIVEESNVHAKKASQGMKKKSGRR